MIEKFLKKKKNYLNLGATEVIGSEIRLLFFGNLIISHTPILPFHSYLNHTPSSTENLLEGV